MSEFSPLFKPGAEFTRLTSAAVTGGEVLVVSGEGTVAPSSAASAAVLGVAAFDAASGEYVTVITAGVVNVDASGAISAGASVAAAASGAVAAHSGTNYSTILGVALSAAANNKVLVKLTLG
jgi:predicted RecA/RadA family phage recombinase